LGFLCSDRDDPSDRRPDNYRPDQFFVYLNPVAERYLIGEDLHPSYAMASHPVAALRKRGVIHSRRLERDSPPTGNDTFLDYWRGLRGVLEAMEGVTDAEAGALAACVAVTVGASCAPQALIIRRLLTANVILTADLIASSR